jgi:hypothetical protein
MGLDRLSRLNEGQDEGLARDHRGFAGRREGLLEFGEDDDAGASLKEALDLDFDVLTNGGVAVVDNDHGAVGQVANALTLVFAFTDDAKGEHFAGQKDDTQGLGHFVEVDVVNALEFGEFAKVVIISEKLRAEVAGKADEFAVDSSFVREIAVVDFDLVGRVFLDAAEDFESATSASALDGIFGVGDLLKFFKHEARNDNDALQEIGFDKVGDATIDDDAGVEQEEVVGLILFCEADVGNDEREIFFVAAHGEDDPDVTKAEEKAEADKPAGSLIGFKFEEAGAIDEKGDDASEKQAEGCGGECAKGKAFEHFIKGYHDPPKAKADDHTNQPAIIRDNKFRAHLADRVAGDRAHEEE